MHKIDDKYTARQKLLNDAFVMSKGRDHEPTAISLECLVSLMKERSGRESFLSSIYFAGSEGDHPTFLRMTKLPSVCRFCPRIVRRPRSPKSIPNSRKLSSFLMELYC